MRLIVLAFVLVILVSAGKVLWSKYGGSTNKVTIAGNSVIVELANTADKQTQGLSGRASLARNKGMLFVYDRPTMPGFWMKDMRFPLDMVWIGSNLKVVGITNDVQPSSYPKSYYPPQSVLYVLEVNAGVASELGWTEGDKVQLNL